MESFTKTLKQAHKQPPKKPKTVEVVDDGECELHFIKGCASCRDTFGHVEEDDDEGWMQTKLKFKKDVGANVYAPKVDDYTVIDPRAGYSVLT
jgi:hypothetical protein